MTIQVPIAKPPFTSLGKKLESSLRKALYEFEMLEDVKNLAVALSGGKDSLTLLFLLHAINGRGFPKFNLHAIHVSGAYTCGAGIDQNFLKAICNRLEVPLVIKESKQNLEDLECYSCSRKRRKILFDTAKELGANTVAFGHHRDDSIQTLMMNLLHKGEFAGNLAKIGMKDYGVTIIRPLIFVKEEDIVSFAKMHHFLRISCQCPVGQNSMRKQTAKLLNEIEDLFPHAKENLARAGLLYGSNKALNP
ncbi:MAG: tRNA 2-thiocytidine biosynthesis TtcA family protein [Chlamydiota bacterium]|jgi:tRNA(Ile)-lysidine synthase TilS/MesJ